jgi:hypothetical protein
MDALNDLMPGGDHSYLVFDARDSTILSITPQAKVAMMRKMSSTPASPDIPSYSFSKPTRDDVIDLGAGEPILGFPTHRYRYLRARTITATFADRVCTQRHSSTQDVWLSTDPRANAIERAIDSAGMHPLSMARARDRTAQADSLSRKRPVGLQLRSVAFDTILRSAGPPIAVRITNEYTELSRAPLDSTLFMAPPGFKMMDVRGINHGDPGGVPRKAATPLGPGCVAK